MINFSKVAKHKINSNKLVDFLYSKYLQTKNENREMPFFTIGTNTIKHLAVTLTKQVKDLYERNFKSLKKNIREDIRGRKVLPCSWIGKIDIVKMATFPNAI